MKAKDKSVNFDFMDLSQQELMLCINERYDFLSKQQTEFSQFCTQWVYNVQSNFKQSKNNS
jgi:hypothetical protein